VREDALQLGGLVAYARIAALRHRPHPLEALLDVVAVGDDELEPDRLEVVRRIRVRTEASQHCEQRVGLPQLAENGRAQTGRVDELDRPACLAAEPSTSAIGFEPPSESARRRRAPARTRSVRRPSGQ
jgi:hypothetical protein